MEATSAIGLRVEHVELETLVRVSQGVSGDMVLEKLIEMVLRTAIEQGNAERVLLIRVDSGEQRIVAEATKTGETSHIELRDLPADGTRIPESVLSRVSRSGESVNLHNVVGESAFATDPYILEHRTSSIVCLPLMNHAGFTGAVYVESNLITQAFVPSQVAVLKLLASQAVTSLENTRVDRNLADRGSRIRRFVDVDIIGIMVWTIDGGILEANDAFLGMVGYDREDVVSGRIRWGDLIPPEGRESTPVCVEHVRNNGYIQPAEKEYIRRDGSRVSVMVGSAVFESTGREGVAFVLDLTERKEAEQRLCESYEMLRELAFHRETVREEERKHIAREMHDELGQYLTALRMRASTLRMQLANDRPELIEQTQALVTLVDETMLVVRSVIASLRPAALDTGIAAGLEWLAAEFNRNGSTVCRLHLQDDNIVVSEDHAVVLFRLVQEALTNVARHAVANNVIISLERVPDACLLQVRDDGRGFDVRSTRRKSFGLAGMKERVLMSGGQIDIISSPGRGTSIKVRLFDR